ncbi:MAG: NAD(P)/FAD-dependent oxidoreductase, partial [Thermoplasmata archaeon]|nr:NAD(P)/FAD-dependent oxidoreductase [Thermoplasmata archaeon]
GKVYRVEFKGYTVDRRRYDKHLVELALQEGAELKTGTVVRRVKGQDVITSDGIFKGKVVVGADGPISKVAESKGLPKNEILAPAVTTHVEGEFEPVAKMYFGRVAPGGYAWIMPKKGGANVGLGVQRRYTGENVGKLFRRFMQMEGFKGGVVTGGHVPVSGPLRTTVKGNAVLVGDSAGHLMASNGGGIPTAMICGKIAGNAIGDHILLRKSLEEYERSWRNAIEKELKNSLTTRMMSDKVFGSDFWLHVAMRCLGRIGLARALRCQRLFPW